MFVSELSLGPFGWVQILNFVLTGTLMLAFGRGLAAHFSTGAASRAGPVLVQILGASLIVSGPFTTDPSAMFEQASISGVVHGVFGALVFTFAPLICFVFYRRFRSDALWHPMAGWTLAAGVVLTLGVVLLKISQQPESGLFEWKGLVQRDPPGDVHGLDLHRRLPPAPPIPGQQGKHTTSGAVMPGPAHEQTLLCRRLQQRQAGG